MLKVRRLKSNTFYISPLNKLIVDIGKGFVIGSQTLGLHENGIEG